MTVFSFQHKEHFIIIRQGRRGLIDNKIWVKEKTVSLDVHKRNTCQQWDMPAKNLMQY